MSKGSPGCCFWCGDGGLFIFSGDLKLVETVGLQSRKRARWYRTRLGVGLLFVVLMALVRVRRLEVGLLEEDLC